MDLFNSNAKNKALKDLEEAQRKYNDAGLKAGKAAEELYVNRKKAVKAIEQLEKRLQRQQDFPMESIKRIADARANIRLFTEAVINDEALTNTPNDTTGRYIGMAIAGTTTGAAVATLGAPAAMALATTFGTAATGTAISTLTGAAATNAALAWIGGGALAVVGGGMATGATILAMAGPIGLAIGGATAGVAFWKTIKRNEKIAREADMAREKLVSTTRNVNNVTNRIERLSDDIFILTHKLQVWEKKPLEQLSVYYDNIVETIEELCIKINEKFHLS